MALLFLVRHAQASFGTHDYDRLSDQGRQQSRWLGEYFKERGVVFSRVVTGTLKRQRDTATELLNNMRGLLPAARSASSKARVLSKFDRMPKSKSASHSPETAEAK
jgi:broad specificity phosphatase PhoE